MDRRDSVGGIVAAIAAALLIGIGSAVSDALPGTLLLVGALFIACAPLVVHTGLVRPLSVGAIPWLAAGSLLVLGVITLARIPVLSTGYVAALLALTMIAIHALLTHRGYPRIQSALIALGHLALMAWMISATPPPEIDVWVFQQQGAAALLEGRNPFAMTFDLDVERGSPFYTDELIEGNQLTFGFIYPPLSLLMALPGYAITGDYRYGAAAALAAAALVMVAIRPGRLAIAGALLLLLNPLTQQVLYWGWTDPFVILLLAAALFFAVRQAGQTGIWLGLLLASKQYMAPMLVPAVVLLRALRDRVGARRLVLVPITIAVATALPFFLWDAAAFIYSTVTVHLLQPFRADSLGVSAVLVSAGLPELPSLASFLAGAGAMALVVWRAPRTPSGLCIGMAIVLLAFFLFSKQAFMHYYYLVLALLACAVAAAEIDWRPEHLAA